MLSFTVQRMRLLEEPSFTTETRALKNKILLLSWAAWAREKEGYDKDIFWKVLQNVFGVETGQQHTSKSPQLLSFMKY